MKEVTKQLVKDFKIYELGYDFMGYRLVKNNINYHHLIIPKRFNGDENYWNGAILMRTSSHDLLHTIEHYEEEMFYQITSEMIDMKNKGYLDVYNLRRIHDMLLYFENEYRNKRNKNGNKIYREIYKNDRINI